MTSLPTNNDHQERLLSLIRGRKEEGMRLLFADYGGALFFLINKVLKEKDDAEETLHDVLLKVWDNIDQYDEDKSRLFTWMARIARNAAIDRTRSKNFKRRGKTDPIDVLVTDREALSHTPSTDGIGVRKLLEGLDENQRAILELLYFQEYTQAETAEALKMPLGTVKTRARRALKELRKLLKLEMLLLSAVPLFLLTLQNLAY